MAKEQDPSPLERQLNELTAEIKRVGDVLQRQVGQQLERRYRNPYDHGDYDRTGRKEPVVLELAHHALAIPFLKNRMRYVPGRAVAEYGEDDDGQYALIECPCGYKPIVRGPIQKCRDCERYYMLKRKGAVVVYGAMPVPGAPAADHTDESVWCELGKCDGKGFIVDEATNTAFDCECRQSLIEARKQTTS